MGSTGGHKIFRVLDTPNSPEATPQEEILEYACTWADGATTKEGACNDIVGEFANHYNWVGNCYELSSDFVRLVASLGVTASENTWSSRKQAYWSTDTYAVGNMYEQRTRTIDPVGAGTGSGTIDWWYHEWSQAEGNQYDPSTASHYDDDTWGDYEDWLYTNYCRITSLSPLTGTWDADQAGQSSGCESSSNRHYTSSSATNLQSWKGPDY